EAEADQICGSRRPADPNGGGRRSGGYVASPPHWRHGSRWKPRPRPTRRLTHAPRLSITGDGGVQTRSDVDMGLVANIRRDLRFVKGLRRLLNRIKPIELDSPVLVCDDWEEAVDRFPDHIAIEDDRRAVSYRELDAMANRFGHWATSRRLKRGDTVALVMLNRAEYIAAWIGFSKVGVAAALINPNLTGHALAHCLNIANASQVVTDEDCWRNV